MGDIKGEMNMYADDISVSETEVKGKLKKIKNTENLSRMNRDKQRRMARGCTWR